MATARDIMHPSAYCIQTHDTAANAARMMAEHDIGALPICDAEDRIKGLVTDRDLAIQVMAAGYDPETYEIGDLPQQHALVTADVAEDADLTLAKMSEQQVRRIPVVEDGRVVGIIAQADVARSLPEPVVGQVVSAVSEPD
ncbi:CBS domain-containing protein [Glycomyces sp. L485]|uniref:CBS domain-containing protein n=1 Tax=Glycomyces sp. L485 TaxID=2909235 RepID=UPI001F4A2363|nr:CBS domain-containing protein [Glycomyces sp. L485]MCH7231917.1 CBS domain-containing protein [Glycomyces sp. L485]